MPLPPWCCVSVRGCVRVCVCTCVDLWRDLGMGEAGQEVSSGVMMTLNVCVCVCVCVFT